jgi:hypothetical protein
MPSGWRSPASIGGGVQGAVVVRRKSVPLTSTLLAATAQKDWRKRFSATILTGPLLWAY